MSVELAHNTFKSVVTPAERLSIEDKIAYWKTIVDNAIVQLGMVPRPDTEPEDESEVTITFSDDSDPDEDENASGN